MSMIQSCVAALYVQMSLTQTSLQNRLLRGLDPLHFAALEPHLTAVELPVQKSLEERTAEITQVYFPESGVVSVLASSLGGQETEAGVIGREGVTGASLFLGVSRSPHDVRVHVAGTGHLVSAQPMRELFREFPAFHDLLLRYAHTLQFQISQTAVASSRATITVRLARWLLMAADRTGKAEMSITHEVLALALAVRRPGVTDAIHRLEGEHLIKALRGKVFIKNRVALEAFAGGFYGAPEAEYERIFGKP